MFISLFIFLTSELFACNQHLRQESSIEPDRSQYLVSQFGSNPMDLENPETVSDTVLFKVLESNGLIADVLEKAGGDSSYRHSSTIIVNEKQYLQELTPSEFIPFGDLMIQDTLFMRWQWAYILKNPDKDFFDIKYTALPLNAPIWGVPYDSSNGSVSITGFVQLINALAENDDPKLYKIFKNHQLGARYRLPTREEFYTHLKNKGENIYHLIPRVEEQHEWLEVDSSKGPSPIWFSKTIANEALEVSPENNGEDGKIQYFTPMYFVHDQIGVPYTSHFGWRPLPPENGYEDAGFRLVQYFMDSQ